MAWAGKDQLDATGFSEWAAARIFAPQGRFLLASHAPAHTHLAVD